MKYRKDDIFAGRYKLVKHLGTGGFAEVWKAEDNMADNSIVALKIFAPDKGLDADGLTVFRREYSLTLPLRHNHLLTASYFDVLEGSPFLVMPYCSEGSLMTRIVNHHEFSEKEIADVMNQLTDGLVYLHKNGITHQDMKPDNVMILESGYYVLADFGISTRIRRSVARSMRADQAKSYSAFTPAYAPPEKYISKPTPSGDIFSLGVTLYECLTGDVPFEDIGAALERGATIPDLPEKYSDGLNDLLQQCMSVDPASRPTAIQLHQSIKTFLAKGKWFLPEIVKPVEVKKPSKRSRKTVRMSDVEPVIKPEETSVAKTVMANPSIENKGNKKRSLLIPGILALALIVGAFAGYNIWSGGNAKRMANSEAAQKENYTKTFYQNILDSTSNAASQEELTYIQNRVDDVTGAHVLFDSQYFDLAAFTSQWDSRQKALISSDSIAIAAAYRDSLKRAEAIVDSLALIEKNKGKKNIKPLTTEQPAVAKTPSTPPENNLNTSEKRFVNDFLTLMFKHTKQNNSSKTKEQAKQTMAKIQEFISPSFLKKHNISSNEYVVNNLPGQYYKVIKQVNNEVTVHSGGVYFEKEWVDQSTFVIVTEARDRKLYLVPQKVTNSSGITWVHPWASLKNNVDIKLSTIK